MTREESLRKHVSDMLAVESHILTALENQLEDDRVRAHTETRQLIERIEQVLRRHVRKLESMADDYDADTQSIVKETLEKMTGFAAGIYDKIRGKHPLSRNLRDDYTALSLASMAYTTMHAYGLTVKEDRVASVALEHLKELTPLLVELSKLLPKVVVEEVDAQNDFATDTSVASRAVENTQKAWSREVTEPTGA